MVIAMSVVTIVSIFSMYFSKIYLRLLLSFKIAELSHNHICPIAVATNFQDYFKVQYWVLVILKKIIFCLRKNQRLVNIISMQPCPLFSYLHPRIRVASTRGSFKKGKGVDKTKWPKVAQGERSVARKLMSLSQISSVPFFFYNSNFAVCRKVLIIL